MMSKTGKRKSGSDSTSKSGSSSSKESQKRPSVFDRLGTKASSLASSLAVNTSSQDNFCWYWAQNGSCPYGSACKQSSSHILVSPSKRGLKKDHGDSRQGGSDKGRRRGSPGELVNWDSWEASELECEDERALERRRQLLRRELQLQLKKETCSRSGGGSGSLGPPPTSKPEFKRRSSSASSSGGSSSGSSGSSSSGSGSSSGSSSSNKRSGAQELLSGKKKPLSGSGVGTSVVVATSQRTSSSDRTSSRPGSVYKVRSPAGNSPSSKGRPSKGSPTRKRSNRRSVSPPRMTKSRITSPSPPSHKLIRRKESPSLRNSRRSSRERSVSRERRRGGSSRDRPSSRHARPRSPRRSMERKKDDDRSRREDPRSLQRKNDFRDRRDHEDIRAREKAREAAREKERIEALERCRERQREREAAARRKGREREKSERDRRKPRPGYDRPVPEDKLMRNPPPDNRPKRYSVEADRVVPSPPGDRRMVRGWEKGREPAPPPPPPPRRPAPVHEPEERPPPPPQPPEPKRPPPEEIKKAEPELPDSDILSDISDDPDDILNQEDMPVEPEPNEEESRPMEWESNIEEPSDSQLTPVTSLEARTETRIPVARDAIEADEAMDSLDFEEISDEELEEEAKVSRGSVCDLLGVDWASLMESSGVREAKTIPAGSARWTSSAIFSRIGISKEFAGETLFAEVKKSVIEEQGGVLLSDSASVHRALKSKEDHRNRLMDSCLTFKRALSARADLSIRRQLCGLPALPPQSQLLVGPCHWLV